MPNLSTPPTAVEIQYQQQALAGVSRTFALTIPLLPAQLEHAVGNAYLLCRIADTIEDDSQLSTDAKSAFSQQLIELVNGANGCEHFATALIGQLSAQTPATERDLIAHTGLILQVTRKLNAAQVKAIQVCVSKMATEMPDFQRCQNDAGLADMATLNSYCYAVAGVVGEMLTDFFCAHSTQIAQQREQLSKLAFSFGQGLQLTNILKDIRADKARGICWLPQDIFSEYGFDLARLDQNKDSPALAAGMNRLIGITHYHLNSALQYALAIPRNETEIRQFLIFPIILALLTLRKLHANASDLSHQQIKISRRSVKLSGLFIKVAAGHNSAVTGLIKVLSRGLPTETPRPY
ncbi:MAG: phytoene synthase [Gammaproteobacteria bacterium]|nr:MAG: phytoene synthase [Gammaproteobacteria bacterium]RLA13187.1 MAG: phytoene synthase [Gammaproteobacteria bacterium]